MKQGIYEQSATPKYPVGLRLAIGDRVFRYCRAAEALTTDRGGIGNGDTLHEQNTALAAVAGDLDLTVVGNFTKDQFAGGYIDIWTATRQICLRIKGNDAGDGVNTVLHLSDPLLYDVPLATFTDIHANIYNNCVAMSNRRSAVCVIITPNVANGNYFWGQTWGPVIATAAVAGGLGLNVNERAVYFDEDGSIGLPADVAGTTNAQYAGFLLPTTAADDIFFMLQLAP